MRFVVGTSLMIRTWWKWVLLYFFVINYLFNMSQMVFAQERKSDKIDIKKIEEHFWSAKDTDFSVIQNRAFPKERRWFFNVSLGALFNDPFTNSQVTRFGLGYYFSERWGVEIAQEIFSTGDNKATQYFKSKNVFPNYNMLAGYRAVSVAVVPFYAKMSFIDRFILYFDMQINVGVGEKSYRSFLKDAEPLEGKSFGYHLDITQNLFFTRHLSLRFDFKNQWAPQKTHYSDTGGGVVKGQMEREIVVNDSVILIGLNVFY
ncbi:MAG: outer membrane beta-barrel domain-containing protein [Bdellovibrionaceae bacterium]|nr:outer membrane beta-barrel domain-containing protein [Pseudobdellovibrionaceae bacterium]MDW8189803.1 outer membrane beta-barrel domain-containing protein [Pseudobdellovibrionaceae bacterium]